jgi:hypothetical protein
MKPDEVSLDEVQLQQIIAAILTAGAAGAETMSPMKIVHRYHQVLEELRLKPAS